jgi:hypothetical protein
LDLLTHTTKVVWRRATPEITLPAEFVALSIHCVLRTLIALSKFLRFPDKNFFGRENFLKKCVHMVGCVLAFGLVSQSWKRFRTVRFSLTCGVFRL